MPHAHPYHSKHSDPIDRAETQIIHITPRAGTIGSRKPANAHGRCQITADNHKSGPHFTINPTISTTIQHTPTGYVHTRRNLPYLIPNCEAKSSWAGLVLAWGTSWEPHGDVTFFFRQHTSNLLRLCTTLPSAIAMSLPPLRYHRNTHAYYHKSTDKIGGRPGLFVPDAPINAVTAPQNRLTKMGTLPAAQSHHKRPQKTTDKNGDAPSSPKPLETPPEID